MPRQPAKKRCAPAVALDVLGGEEADERLRDGEADHAATPSSSAQRRHRVRAREPRGDVRARGVGQPDRALERPALEQPVHERAAERVARAEPADDLDRHRRHLDRAPSRVRASTPSGPRLTIASCTPSSSSASAAASGSRVPTATATSSRLPTATVACASAARAHSPASLSSAQNIGRWSRSWTVTCRASARSSSAASVARGSAPPTARCRSSRTRAPRGSRRGRARSGASVMSGAVGSR